MSRATLRRGLRSGITLLGLLALSCARPHRTAAPVGGISPPAPPEDKALVVDDFEHPAAWSSHPADGVKLSLQGDRGVHGRALRLDFDFVHGGGYAVVHRDLDLDLPENYVFSFRIRGQAPPNALEFKLIDGSEENVWWSVRRDVQFSPEWQRFTIKKRHISFAWGPRGGGEIHHVAAIEFAVTAGQGGRGSVWLDDLELKALPPPGAPPPRPIAHVSSAAAGHPVDNVLDQDSSSTWMPAPGDDHPSLELDFQRPREFGGLSIEWRDVPEGLDYDVELSDDGGSWRKVREVRGSNGGRDDLSLPESESRFLKLVLGYASKMAQPAVAEITIRPLAWSATRNHFFEALAAESPRGDYPRGFSGEQSYWTVVGVDADPRESLFGEDGAIEATPRHLMVEPLLRIDDRLLDWSKVQARPSLADGFLPLPSVSYDTGPIELRINAFADGEPGASSIVVRYRIWNSGDDRQRPSLYLALRPFQVNPPSQTLNQPGGTVEIHRIRRRGRVIEVDGESAVICLSPPAAFGATTFDGGDIVGEHLRRGELPAAQRVQDPFGAASAALAYHFDLAPADSAEVDLLLPLHAGAVEIDEAAFADPATWVRRRFAAVRSGWFERTGKVELELPRTARRVADSMKAQLGYILVNRAGPAIQPGARSYARSWIRDGALTSSVLLRLGHADVVREFLEWFAPYQYRSGKIPCVVDHRGADPVPEHDSSGEFIFLVAEYDRYTGDVELTRRMWPRVRAAVAYLDSLRQLRRGDRYRKPENAEFFGILPPSISHEGYSAKPMHSYWDDLFAWRGFVDAAFLAGRLGLADEHDRIMAIGREFEGDLRVSIEASMRRHGIDYVPGSADLGDFDPTATTIALAPLGAESAVPEKALHRTFERYWDFFTTRREENDWEAFTPYEIRNVDAFAHLGWRERARALLDFFLDRQRPAGWRQWPEVVRRHLRDPGFLGDLPHTWVGSDYVRAVLDMVVYAREKPSSLVVGAGVPLEWLSAEGLKLRGLRTPFGRVDVTMRRTDDEIAIEIGGDLRLPEGGIVVAAPAPWPIATATVNGQQETLSEWGEIVLREIPARIRLRP